MHKKQSGLKWLLCDCAQISHSILVLSDTRADEMGQRASIVSVAGEEFKLRSARLVCLHTAVARKNILLRVFVTFYYKVPWVTATHTAVCAQWNIAWCYVFTAVMKTVLINFLEPLNKHNNNNNNNNIFHCLNVSLTLNHELTIQNYQRDALNIIYSSQSDGTICCLCTTISSWRWVLDTRNM